MKKDSKSILIVDDNKDLLNVLDLVLSGHGWKVDLISSPNQLSYQLRTKAFDVILLDMNFQGNSSSGNEGFYWLREIKKLDKDQTVVMITAYGDIDTAVKSLKEGAVDFIDKAWDQAKILSTLEAAWQISVSKRQISKLLSQRTHLSKQIGAQLPIYWGNSQAIRNVRTLINKVSKTNANVLILGENGTGKEVVANEIHQKSLRCDEVFISVDMGSVPESLFESEMFGHEKGAFTGAAKAKVGRMLLADGGSLFLDEIANLSPEMQAKLLRVLESRQIITVGGNKVKSIDFRLITATNSPLPDLVKNGTFRQDLFYRLNTITINLPSLKERGKDIHGLTKLFTDYFNQKHSKEHQLRKEDLNRLEKYSWPGNVRQLKHTIERSVILSDGPFLDIEYIDDNENRSENEETAASLNIAQNEQKLINEALTLASGNISKAAELLGINRTTVYDKIKKYRL